MQYTIGILKAHLAKLNRINGNGDVDDDLKLATEFIDACIVELKDAIAVLSLSPKREHSPVSIIDSTANRLS